MEGRAHGLAYSTTRAGRGPTGQRRQLIRQGHWVTAARVISRRRPPASLTTAGRGQRFVGEGGLLRRISRAVSDRAAVAETKAALVLAGDRYGRGIGRQAAISAVSRRNAGEAGRVTRTSRRGRRATITVPNGRQKAARIPAAVAAVLRCGGRRGREVTGPAFIASIGVASQKLASCGRCPGRSALATISYVAIAGASGRATRQNRKAAQIATESGTATRRLSPRKIGPKGRGLAPPPTVGGRHLHHWGAAQNRSALL